MISRNVYLGFIVIGVIIAVAGIITFIYIYYYNNYTLFIEKIKRNVYYIKRIR